MPSSSRSLGLTSAQAAEALRHAGFNELVEQRRSTPLKVFARQFKSVIVWILAIAAGISYAIGEAINFWVIVLIVGFVIVLGFLQEYKAERAMEALRRIVKPVASVFRDGRLVNLEARLIVPGDLLSLETGDAIPADATVLEEVSLKTDESTLTGESAPVRKAKGEMVFAGTQLVSGRGQARVVSTGMNTRLGTIATLIQQDEDPTPLQLRMDRLGKLLALVAIVACFLILSIGLLRGASPVEMLIVALALSVSAVPEGLPFTMTLSLSYGMRNMAAKNAIIRRMMAVETLGSTTVICSDKTGTLTKNEMTVQRVYVGGQVVQVAGTGYRPEGLFKIGTKAQKRLPAAADLFRVAALCNNSNLVESAKGIWSPVGDPTEVALLTLAAKGGFDRKKLHRQHKRVEEILFTSDRKMMTTIHRHEDGFWVATKGAPEEVLSHCSFVEEKGKTRAIVPADIEAALAANRAFARKALRVLALAKKTVSGQSVPVANAEQDLVFLGLVGMKDPARPEVKGALQTCRKAGIDVIMITGDNEHTALAVAREIGLVEDGDHPVLTGKALDSLNERALKSALKRTRVFARTHSEHKMRIVSMLKKLGHVVAMTGDGVNDAPALKKADIGVAMGIKGTDVAKGAADMILQDDHFATIVEAVKEGRLIYQNIEKFTAYLISRNFTEILLIFLGLLFFDFSLMPLLALQILLLNAFDEEMPAIALGMDKPTENLMARNPRNPRDPILGGANAFLVFSMALVMALTAFLVFVTQNPAADLTHARTMVFATILCMMFLDTYNFRSLRESIFKVGILDNRFLMIAVVSIVAITLFLMYHPTTQAVFQFAPLSWKDWLLCVAASSITLIYVEVVKYFRRKLSF